MRTNLQEFLISAREELLRVTEQKQDQQLATTREQLLNLVAEKQEKDWAAARQQILNIVHEKLDEYLMLAREDLVASLAKRQAEGLGTIRTDLAAGLSQQLNEQVAVMRDQLWNSVSVELESLKASQNGLRQTLAQVEQSRTTSADQISKAAREHAASYCQDLLAKVPEEIVSRMRDEIAELIGRGSTGLDEQWHKLRAELDITAKDLFAERGREVLAMFENEREKIQTQFAEQLDEQQREIQRATKAQIDRMNFEIQDRLGPLLTESNRAANDLRSILNLLNDERNRSEEQIGTLPKHKIEFEQWLADQISARKTELSSVFAVETTVAVTRAGAQIENAVKELESAALDRARSDLSREWKSVQGRVTALESAINRTLKALEMENRLSQAQIETVHQEREDLAAWLRQRSTDFHKEVSDALIDAQAQINSRFRTATEMFERPVQDLCQGVLRELEQHSTEKTKQFQDQVDAARNALRDIQEGVKASVTEFVAARSAEMVASFQDDLKGMRQQILGELRTALATDLISFAKTFSNHPESDRIPEDNERS